MSEDVAVLSLGQRLRHRSAGLDLWYAREKTEFRRGETFKSMDWCKGKSTGKPQI